MKILLTNDDGWGAPGLKALEATAAQFGEVWVVAPRDHQSGCSHQITFDRPLTLTEHSERSFDLDGMPADCVRIGLTQLEQEFDWVWSGVNHGGNLGTDVYLSGTVAAAREGSLLGVPSIAISQVRKSMGQPFDWSITTAVAKRVIEQNLHLAESLVGGTLLNINLPDLGGEVHPDEYPIHNVANDRCGLPVDYGRDAEQRFVYQGVYFDRARTPDQDVDVCFSGGVSVSVLQK